jgi:hypothetical protein
VQAQLVDDSAQRELERVLVREAQVARQIVQAGLRLAPAHTVTPSVTRFARDHRQPKVARRRHSPLLDLLFMRMPAREVDALPAVAIAKKAGRDRSVVEVTLARVRKLRDPRLGVRNVAPPESQRGRWVYWRAA